MRQLRSHARILIHRGLRAVVGGGIVVSIAVFISGCGEKKTDSEIDSLVPDITGIAEQIKKTRLESGVRKSGERWTKFVLTPRLTKFQLLRTMYQNEPYRLKVYVNYQMQAMSKPAETEAQAKAAKFDSESDFPVTLEFVYQKDHWYLDKLDSQGMKAGPLGKREIDELLSKSIRRML